MSDNSPEFQSSPRERCSEKGFSDGNNGRSLMYRYEHNGVLVYDSKARVSTNAADLVATPLHKQSPVQLKKEIEKVNEYGNLY
jgi:hypothetical protein